MEIMDIIPHIGVVFSFEGLLALDSYHLDFLVILKEMLSNPVLQQAVLSV